MSECANETGRSLQDSNRVYERIDALESRTSQVVVTNVVVEEVDESRRDDFTNSLMR